jgi:hypothetical protein
VRRVLLFSLLILTTLDACAVDLVTVELLEKEVASARGKPDKDAAKLLGQLELTQRLGLARYERLRADLPGEKSMQALLAVADASAFLDPPAADILPFGPPDSATQTQMLSHAADFVIATTSRMPDFLAERTTTRFQDRRVSQLVKESVVVLDGSFHFVDRSTVGVVFRNGWEVTEPAGRKRSRKSLTLRPGLINWGEFGPLLGIAMADLLNGKVGWSHWEQGPFDRIAVFRYVVAKETSHYTVRYCCVPGNNGKMVNFEVTPQYHGEIAVDAGTGTVLWLALKTDLDPNLPITRADVMVQYSTVEIGGRNYICPVKSVSISTALSMRPIAMYGGGLVRNAIYDLNTTAINDVVFDKYHMFRSEMRILPGASADLDGAFIPPAPASHKP